MTDFLPITQDEVRRRGWDEVDIVLVSGDAYVDHPSFGTAVIGRTLESAGYRVAILPQPNWRDDLRDFRKFGRPRLFFGVTSGVMDSMVNHYTAARRLRHDDAYTPGGNAGFRPDYATYCYTRILKQLYPDIPVVIGGVEASMRRLAHYDYWSDALKPSILMECPADLLLYGMAERSILAVAELLQTYAERNGGAVSYGCPEGIPPVPLQPHLLQQLRDLPQVAYRMPASGYHAPAQGEVITLHNYDECLRSKRCEAENFHHIERESNKIQCATLLQYYPQPQGDDMLVVVNPPYPSMTTQQIDASFDLPYLRQPHPKYKKRGAVPAFEMIRNSINTHRGCFGGCSFCTISAHQGKQIASRSTESILREVKRLVDSPDFHGVISDLGGPSANMYGMHGRDPERCRSCARYSCIHPTHCSNLVCDHAPLIDLYRAVAAIPGVKHLYIGSGIRCDLFTEQNHGWDYFRHVVLHHVSGRLKVAPEHTSSRVLAAMRKPTFDLFVQTKQRFDAICRTAGLRYQLIPYFISSHPGCQLKDMADLAVQMKAMGYRLEQIQDFTPTPMTLSTEMYYTGINPATMEPIYVATHPNEKREQNLLFFYYKREHQADIRKALARSNNAQYIKKLGL